MSYLTHQPKQAYHLPHGINSADNLNKAASDLGQIIWTSTGLLIELLLVRFMIAFLGANPNQTLFHYIYSLSQPLVNPFLDISHSLFPTANFYRVEIPTLIAIAFYALVGYGVAKLLTRPASRIN